MSILTQIASNLAVPVAVELPASKTMQDVHDDAAAVEKKDEAKAVRRLADFFAQPLRELPADVDWFDETFPLAKSSSGVPGQDRGFWKSLSAYNKWRNKARRRIEHTLGNVAREQERKARKDGWAPLIDLVGTLSKDGGPIHGAEAGAIAALAGRARRLGIEPSQLSRQNIDLLLDAAANTAIRRKNVRALQVLKRYQCVRSIAAHLPPVLDIDAARRRFENVLPPRVEDWIERMLETARRDPEKFDPTTGKYTDELTDTTVATYRSALRTYAWSASMERGGPIALEKLIDIGDLASGEVFYAVVACWNDHSGDRDGISARTAYEYVTTLATVLGRNGFDVGFMLKALKNSIFLREGEAANGEMSPKNVRFCRPLVTDVRKRRQFLTQHFEYRRRANEILATDKVLSASQLRQVRMFGTCAAFAALELCGAPMRVKNVLQLRHRGPASNLHLPKGNDTHFLLKLDAREMKVKTRRQVPPIRIRANALEGAQTLDWYLQTIRPLFPFGNPSWCDGEDQPVDLIRFGNAADHKERNESIHLFVAPESAAHLSKSVFYEWITEASDAIGMPMTAHNFRHGLASILLKRSLANLEKVAKFLGNTPAVVQRNYAWINTEAVIEETQDEILDEALG